jgi:hypothetical protein
MNPSEKHSAFVGGKKKMKLNRKELIEELSSGIPLHGCDCHPSMSRLLKWLQKGQSTYIQLHNIVDS